ncbi:Glycoside hydrolase family 71 [Lasiodiplodia theobromae]|uniref:Glycoside hydrolase family 71 n=1 Tax=Lasiodiplodia theobromae TaxID=45133 RepID=UPI0015C2E6FD|nr:Glycoside hydrolase family 71 [Lasiodiplodia theobromae]KAF4543416.1 Glycoside hydrolase family 71 [Lasiodiplodia theobromae]
MRSLLRCLPAAIGGLLYARTAVADGPKGVFAHYMAGTIFENHIKQDVHDAAKMGLDGFAVNIGDPLSEETRIMLNTMFDYAASNHPEFKMFISMDLWAPKNLSDFDSILTDFLGHAAYYRGSDGYPFVSTYGGGNFAQNDWSAWRDRWARNIYFVPDFADLMALQGSQGWWDEWGFMIAGLFSWESTWPIRGQASTLEVARVDAKPEWTEEKDKAYMIGLSMLQYKNSYGANIYRAGEENLPLRIQNILNMPEQPEFTQILTWNDGPESHYMGNIWPEQDNTTQMRVYANDASSHTGIQPLLASFTAAFKSGLTADKMAPFGTNANATGALWFKPILADTSCPDEDDGDLHNEKPSGYEVAVDVSTWAVVVGEGKDGWTVQGYSGGETLGDKVELVQGLNYGNFSGMREGKQCVEVRDKEGTLVAVAKGGREVSKDCPDGIYNLNPQVLELSENVGDGGCVDEEDDGDDDDDGKDDDDSWGVRAVEVNGAVMLIALLASLVSVMGTSVLC